ncbi:hypothetical protein MHYP_G00208430 [Metynnis hypsauchen]
MQRRLGLIRSRLLAIQSIKSIDRCSLWSYRLEVFGHNKGSTRSVINQFIFRYKQRSKEPSLAVKDRPSGRSHIYIG